jgi:long-chain acyl-CoA synthetase
MLARSCEAFAERPAFRNLGVTVSYRDLDRLTRDFAAFLQSLQGLGRGSRIAIMMPNLLQYPVALFGILRAGMVVVNVNPLYTPRELRHQLEDSGAEAIVVMENFAHVLQKVLPHTRIKHVISTQAGDALPLPRRLAVNFVVKRIRKMVPVWDIANAIPFRAALEIGTSAPLTEYDVTRNDIALLQYTGGTTGTSKGAVLTHGNLLANLLQSKAWTEGIFEEGAEIIVTALPLYHIFSLTLNCMLFTKLGGMNLLITDPRDMRGFVNELKRSRFTVVCGVNTLFNGLLNAPGIEQVNFRQVKFAVGGGAPIQRPVAERWQDLTGRSLVEGYGLTEASPLVSCNPLDTAYSGTVGLPMPSTEISIRDENNRALAPGETGEICVRGPQVMQGYWQRPLETQEVFTPDGWLRTGDIGAMDSRGYSRVTDRRKDMILVSGFNVYPAEVEAVIAAIPQVLECAVVGVPDATTGERVKAYIVKRDDALSMESVVAYCREHLTNYKVPRAVEFLAELPKNPIGKILRRELRDAARTPEPAPAAGLLSKA